MTMRTRGLAVSLAVLILAAGCSRVPTYLVSSAKSQSPQQMDNDTFECNLQAQKQTNYNPDKSLTEGALRLHSNVSRSEEHTSELQSHSDLVCRLLLEKKKNIIENTKIRNRRH